jgi:cellulose synthase operon protein YhjU
MGFWSCYFLLKLFLYYGGYIELEPWWNLALFAFVAWPLRMRLLRILRLLVAVPAGAALLYSETFLPPIGRVMQTAGDVATFSGPYLLELAARMVNPAVLGGMVVVVLLWLLLAHRLRMSSFALVGLLTAPLVPMVQHWLEPRVLVAEAGAAAPQPLTRESLTTRVNSFFATEATRRVSFPSTVEGPPFDIVLLHICSLGWDDMQLVEMADDRLIQRLDVLMTQFNSASSYSGPAAIRVLRSGCGQPRHEALYDTPQPECQLMHQLEQTGFEVQWEMNHSGRFGDFSGVVAANLGVDVKTSLDPTAQVTQRAFDDSPVLSDYDVLSHWWERRLRSPAERVALYYNGASLHDGNRIEGYRTSNVVDSYRHRLRSFLDDTNRFLDLLAQSGRRVVVVLVPEHGAALRGERRQMSGLREIPSWPVTHVPAGVEVLGPDRAELPQQRVELPTSHLALSQLLANLTTDNPYAGNIGLDRQLSGLPTTDAVSENEGTVVMRVGSQFHMRTPDGSWTLLD